MDKSNRVFRKVKSSTTLTTWYSKLPLVLNALFVLPLVLKHFDLSDVALYYLVGSFVRYQDIADFGFGLSYSRYYAYAYAGAKSLLTNDIQKIRGNTPQLNLIAALYRSNKKDYLFIAALFVIVFGGFATYQMREFLNDETLLYTWVAFVFSVALKIRYKFVESFIVGVQEVARLRLVTGHISSAQVFLLFIVLFLTKSICAGIWVNISFMWLTIIRNYVLSRQIMKEKDIDASSGVSIERTVKKELVSVAFKSGWGNLVTSGLYTTSGFIFTPVLAEMQLAVLLFSNKIIDVIKDLSNAPFYSKLPELNTLVVRDQHKLREKAKLYVGRSSVVYFLGVLGFLWLKDSFLELLGGDLRAIPHLYWIGLALAFFLERMGSVAIQLYSVSNKIKYHLINTAYFVVSTTVLWSTVQKGMYSYPLSLIFGLLTIYLPMSMFLLFREYKWGLFDLFRTPLFMFCLFVILCLCYV